MNRDAEARKILRLIAAGRFQLVEHAFVRGNERGISREQIIHCARGHNYFRWQEDKGTHLFIGYLDSNTTGGFSAVMRNGAIIVTVFRRRLAQWEKILVKSQES
jgi:sarcosine oxidase delta subunit